MMPRVYRTVDRTVFGGSYDYNEQLILPWNELTNKERGKAIAKRLAVLGILSGFVIASLPKGPIDFWGDLKNPISPAAQRADLRKQAAELYKASTTAGKFSLLYIKPETIYTPKYEPGKGILGFFNGGSLGAQVGQNCLVDTAYNITPSLVTGFSRGKFSPVAAFHVDASGNFVSVNPSGSADVPLNFTIGATSLLHTSDPATERTIDSYGCSADVLAVNAIIDNDAWYPKYEALPVQ